MKLKRDPKDIKFTELNNYEPLDVHRWSDYPEVNSLVDSLYEEFKQLPDFKGYRNIQKKHIKVVVLDLYVKWRTDPTMYVGYYRMKAHYKGEGRYNKLFISFTTVKVVDTLSALGYIEHVPGFHDRDGKRSFLSRMRATDKLIDLIINKEGVTPEMIEKAPNTECIIQKDEIKQLVEYEDGVETKRMRAELYAYNNLLRSRFIDIPNFPKEGVLSRSGNKLIKINRTSKFVRRIFNNSTFKHGGRYYGGWWQNLPKEWRSEIVIDNYPTQEIDYSGLHIVILYALEGVDYWATIGRDPYQLEGFEPSERMRDLLKQVLLISINAKDKKIAIGAIGKHIADNIEEYAWIRREGFKIGSLIDRFREMHSPIEKRFFSSFGVELQNIDSRIAEHIINNMVKAGYPVLCIHDSFIVGSCVGNELRLWMDEAFNAILCEVAKMREDILPKTKEMGITQATWEHMLTKAGCLDLAGLSEKNYDPTLLARVDIHNKTDWNENYYGDREINYNQAV